MPAADTVGMVAINWKWLVKQVCACVCVSRCVCVRACVLVCAFVCVCARVRFALCLSARAYLVVSSTVTCGVLTTDPLGHDHFHLCLNSAMHANLQPHYYLPLQELTPPCYTRTHTHTHTHTPTHTPSQVLSLNTLLGANHPHSLPQAVLLLIDRTSAALGTGLNSGATVMWKRFPRPRGLACVELVALEAQLMATNVQLDVHVVCSCSVEGTPVGLSVFDLPLIVFGRFSAKIETLFETGFRFRRQINIF